MARFPKRVMGADLRMELRAHGARTQEVDRLALDLERLARHVDPVRPFRLSQGEAVRLTGLPNRSAWNRDSQRLCALGAIAVVAAGSLRDAVRELRMSEWVVSCLVRVGQGPDKDSDKDANKDLKKDLSFSSLSSNRVCDAENAPEQGEQGTGQGGLSEPGQGIGQGAESALAALIECQTVVLGRIFDLVECLVRREQAAAVLRPERVDEGGAPVSESKPGSALWGPGDSEAAAKLAADCEAVRAADSGSYPDFLTRLYTIDAERVRCALNHVRLDQASGRKVTNPAALLVRVAQGKVPLREGASCEDEAVTRLVEDAKDAKKKERLQKERLRSGSNGVSPVGSGPARNPRAEAKREATRREEEARRLDLHRKAREDLAAITRATMNGSANGTANA